MIIPVFVNVDRRTALTVPTLRSQAWTQSVVILVVSLLSLLGAGWMILSFFCFKSLRSFRHQLILGLALSDFLMAANFVLSTTSNISGRDLAAPEQAALCSFSGFMTQVFVIQTDYWVFLISLCTYFVLAGFKRPSSWVQDHRLILAALPWIFYITWASIGLGTAGYGNIGAWCWFTSDQIRLLVNFIPRWTIIFAILFMYGNLYYILRRAHRRMLSLRYCSSEGVSRQCNAERLQQPQEHPGPSANPQPSSSNPAEAEDRSTKMKNLARRMLLYPLAYMLIWSLPTAIRIYQATRGVRAPFPLQTVDKSCIVLQGFIDAVIYGINESSLAHWRNLLFPKPDEIEEIQLGSNNYGFHSRTGLNSKTLQQMEERNNSLSTVETDQFDRAPRRPDTRDTTLGEP
ncbi:uncharacterized protein NECHADRAFT_44345 [Fusarium vanettenii 77-13-4]|uniref:G-protein coupled receptors family 2 profile 2 domain-containing protein n=1 Tax=Fusarium vanettenii (strain ATCC MYA-4622 / CBS 123669 / FGSC 9596 / NRRL 45880 / 77-13-4) TaxID=660122 RepID=C7ZJP7_FUSV7|nr:uncharacterized protein NECHADRAFT_44345 [Fusarium vanettenii 77-13-4]EEU35776.1 hypothetical protein NECHADRAFT_44345 [Fusarium vanettenii 77-13-4]